MIVIAGDHQYNVDVHDESVEILINHIAHEFNPDGLFVIERSGPGFGDNKFTPLKDYLMEEASTLADLEGTWGDEADYAYDDIRG